MKWSVGVGLLRTRKQGLGQNTSLPSHVMDELFRRCIADNWLDMDRMKNDFGSPIFWSDKCNNAR